MTTNQNYQQIYRVGGMLDAGFVGQITYTISLDQVYDELDIHFSFDKRLYSESDVTPELIDKLQTLCTAKYDAPTYPVEKFRQTILHEMKTEIHTMAELNDNFIGCIHRQLTDRHMLYTKEFTSDGCLAQDTFSGVLKVTVLVFNVLLDNTQYTLTVSGHPVRQGVIAPNFNLMDTVKTAAGNTGASNAAGSADTSCEAESAPASAVATAGSSGVSGAGSAATAGDSSTTGSSSAGNTVTASTRFKRLELHNHTVESDGSLTCQELTEYLAADHVDAFAITDHNTTSGQKKIEQLLEEKHYPISLIRGMEYTTYFGHILCLNLSKYVPWNSIDQHRPELLFEAAREKGALVGIAHPFSYGDPFARGCRFEMTVSDYSKVDFIEIFNNPESLHEVNERGTNLWMSLIFSGYQITATSGMDLHNRIASDVYRCPQDRICCSKNSSGRFKRKRQNIHNERFPRQTGTRFPQPALRNRSDYSAAVRSCLGFLRQRCRSFDILQQYCGCQLCCRAVERNRRTSCNRRTALRQPGSLQGLRFFGKQLLKRCLTLRQRHFKNARLFCEKHSVSGRSLFSSDFYRIGRF